MTQNKKIMAAVCLIVSFTYLSAKSQLSGPIYSITVSNMSSTDYTVETVWNFKNPGNGWTGLWVSGGKRNPNLPETKTKETLIKKNHHITIEEKPTKLYLFKSLSIKPLTQQILSPESLQQCKYFIINNEGAIVGFNSEQAYKKALKHPHKLIAPDKDTQLSAHQPTV